MNYRNVHIVVKGRVQGVYFRATAVTVATQYKVTGRVKNTAEGSVDIIAEGAKEAVEKFIQWCRTGPEAAQVDSVDITEGVYSGDFTGFTIKT